MPEHAPAWQPNPAELKALAPAGRAFVRTFTERYEFSPMEGRLLLEAAHAVGQLASVRKAQTRSTGPSLVKLARLELAWSRQLAALLAQLRVDDAR